MKIKRIKAEDLQWKNYDIWQEEYSNTRDVEDLLDEYGTRLSDGTIDPNDSKEIDARHEGHHFQIKKNPNTNKSEGEMYIEFESKEETCSGDE
jgi:hypothetical protein